jgi:hypothetical protein
MIIEVDTFTPANLILVPPGPMTVPPSENEFPEDTCVRLSTFFGVA